jgi:hypothetical protein
LSKTSQDTEGIIVDEYRPPIGDRLGFWTREKILEIRYAATEALEKT